MKIVFLIFAALMSGATFASTQQYRVQAQLLINGKVVAQPQILAQLGQRAETHQGAIGANEQMRMSVLANALDSKGEELKLDLDLKYISGRREIHTKPQVFATAGSEAVMELEESSATEKIQLRVLAKAIPKQVIR